MINYDKRVYGEPKLLFITNVLIKNKFIEKDDFDIFKYILLAEELIRDYGFELILSITDYIIKWSKTTHITIENKFEYFKTSAYRNISMLEKRNQGGSFNIEKELREIL